MLKHPGIDTKRQLLTASLCARVLKSRDPRATCRQRDVDTLKAFLASRHNLVTDKLAPGPRARLEAEIGSAARRPDARTITTGARAHLAKILKEVYSPWRYGAFHAQSLVPQHILVPLEAVYAANSRTNMLKRSVFQGLWRLLVTVGEGLRLLPNLEARTLRRKCAGIESLPGQEIAHKLSLFLATRLWRHVHGRGIRRSDHRQLRHALSRRANVYHTCVHTNRVLHVKWDNEIAAALAATAAGGTRVKLSPGAKTRLKQVVVVLRDLDSHSDTMMNFCSKSKKLLAKLR